MQEIEQDTLLSLMHAVGICDEQSLQARRILRDCGIAVAIHNGQVISSRNVNSYVSDILVQVGFAKSKTHAKRLIESGAIKINNDKVTDTNMFVFEKCVLWCGKRCVLVENANITNS